MPPTDAPIRPTNRLRRTCRGRALTAWGLATLTAFTTLGGGTGCTTWSAVPVPRGRVAPAVAYHHPVRLRLANGNTVVLTHARFAGDSVLGITDDADDGFHAFAAALGDVRGLEERHVSGGRTAALVLVPLVALGVLIAVGVSSSNWKGLDIPGPKDLMRAPAPGPGPGWRGVVRAP